MSALPTLSLEALSRAVRDAVAVRAVLTLQPAGGKGSKVFPPTYASAKEGADKGHFGHTKYATETRRIDGQDVPCVLLDSVASQANRFEQALLDAWESEELDFPVLRVDFSDADLPEAVGTVTTLDAPHRIYDAILRDSVDDQGMLFRMTPSGKAITAASPRDATALFELCPTALVFGAWDSTGHKGGLGSKFPRAIASEIVGVDVQTGSKVGGRLDPLGIQKVMDVVYGAEGTEKWTTDKPGPKAKALAPSEINHGNIAPTRVVDNGGVTFDHARQTTVLSIPALRRLKFPKQLSGEPHANRRQAEHAAHTALAALAIAGVANAHHQGHDLRSGTLLVAQGPLVLEIVEADGTTPHRFQLSVDAAASLLTAATQASAAVGLGWQREPVPTLRPAPKLLTLLRASQEHAMTKAADAAEE